LVSIIVVLENISTAKLRIVFQNRKHLLNFVASKLSKMKTINTRKTIRKYTNKDVSEDLLKTLLEKAERTPTMGNLQLYSVVITRNEEKKTQLAPAHFNQPMVMGAPVVLTFCADFRRTTLWAENRKATPGYDNFLSFLNAATDALLYCQTFCNLAEEEGLGTCFLGTTIYNPKTIIEVLQLPRLVMPIATITLGWPDEDPALVDRLPIDSIIHNETYEDYTPERIDAFYTPKEQLEENKHFVEINNKETLAQVFTDLRYTKEANEALSKVLINSLKNQGFIKE
jgi:putative nitroreductase family protein